MAVREQNSDIATTTVAFVGAGPTATYTLHTLVRNAPVPFALTIFEEQRSAGRGTPYRPGWNDPAMLSNIASIEIPPLEQTLSEWLRAQSPDRLRAHGIEPDAINDRAFYPRLALGEFFKDQFEAILEHARQNGIDVRLKTRCRVTDAVSGDDGMTLTVQPRHGSAYTERFDHVVLATGHQWPAHPEVSPGYYASPWPASDLAKIAPTQVGIRGTSLTAIDAAVALAVAHGSFDEKGDFVRYKPASGTQDFHMTMLSRKGLLPEADFYGPLPYDPLSVCTPDAVEKLIAADEDNLLDRAFSLFKRELALADPDYATSISLDGLSLEEFHDRYFAEREKADTFDWAKKNLAEAAENYRNKVTVPWRYAILRMHEPIELLVPHFEQEDYERFSKYFKPVFVDDYATVPHTSIRRMIALHEAGKLDIVALGDHYRLLHRSEGVALETAAGTLNFPVFIEATGQKALGAKSFPFPSLRQQGIVRDAAGSDGRNVRGIAIDDQFHPISDALPEGQLYCLSLPFILGRHPFHQGITSSHAMGLSVGEELAGLIATRRRSARQEAKASA
ncbi:MAG TPA: FAD/NAD(P)-binding protein [Rhizomicrobium sp.]|jgi:uncharacterized NAD(P)/FAD-binding protein YdhS|nr:FAD/NAD(P)-binding protein [Rhizomicrobium sp.]